MGKRGRDPDSDSDLEQKPDLASLTGTGKRRATGQGPDAADTVDVKPDVKPNPSTPAAKARPWTGAEQQLLLKLVVERGKTEAFRSVPGRSYDQCRMAWRWVTQGRAAVLMEKQGPLCVLEGPRRQWEVRVSCGSRAHTDARELNTGDSGSHNIVGLKVADES